MDTLPIQPHDVIFGISGLFLRSTALADDGELENVKEAPHIGTLL